MQAGRRRRAALAAAAIAVLVAACGGGGGDAPAPTEARGGENGASAATANVAASAEPEVQMHSEGLRLGSGSPGEANLAFGAAQSEALARLGSLGTPRVSTNAECGAGPMEIAEFPNGLSLLFQEGRFVGWSIDGRSENRLTTTAGIGTGGSTRAELEAAYPGATVEESTLGQEFSADGIGGLLGGAGPEARITALWAGTTCMFR